MSVVDLGKEISQHFFQSFSPFPSLLLFINLISWAAHFSDCIWWRPTSLLPREWRTLWKKVRIHCCRSLSYLLQYCLSPFPDFEICHESTDHVTKTTACHSGTWIQVLTVLFHWLMCLTLHHSTWYRLPRILSKYITRCHSILNGTLPRSAFASVWTLLCCHSSPPGSFEHPVLCWCSVFPSTCEGGNCVRLTVTTPDISYYNN
jgi:hypothetical protein